jgi:hypothetical protein
LPFDGATQDNCAWTNCEDEWKRLADTIYPRDTYSECPSSAIGIAVSFFLLLVSSVAVTMF